MKMIFATRDIQDRPAIHMVESLEPGKAGDAVLIWQGMDWRTAEGDTNLDLLLKICAELWSVNVTRDQISYVKRALSNTNGWTVSDDCRDWDPPRPPAEWVEHEQEQRYPDEADGLESQLFEATVHMRWQSALIRRQQEVLRVACDALGRFRALEAQGHELAADLDWIESGLRRVVDEYLKLARLVVDWYTAPPDDGFSPETEALQRKARWLSETPESAWL